MDKNTIKLINMGGSNGYGSALNDYWEEIKKLDDDNKPLTRSNLFKIWENLKEKGYVALDEAE